MGQLSFYSAEANSPRVADLAGVLCGPGQAVGFGAGTAAKLSVTLPQRWRAHALVAACAERGVRADLVSVPDGKPVVRTAFRADLVDLAGRWLRDTEKAVPEPFTMDGVTLRLWALVAGHWTESGYLLGLDPASPQTHQPLVDALVRAGVPATLVRSGVGPGDGPAVRVAGIRRLARLVELVGEPPAGVPGQDWPAVRTVGARRKVSVSA